MAKNNLGWVSRRLLIATCIALLGACAEDVQDASEQVEAKPALSLEGPNALKFSLPSDLRKIPAFAGKPSGGAIGGITQSVVNGVVLPNAIHGILSIWGWVPQYEEWRQICTGTLITNQVLLTARHCFEEPAVDPNLYLATHDSQVLILLGGQVAPNDLDAALLVMHEPVWIYGTNSGYRRPIVSGAAGQWVFAIGYGWSATSPVASNVCRSGTKGCDADRRALTLSSHMTVWDGSRSDIGMELGVTSNAQGQFPYEGDSGGPLLQASGTFPDIASRGVHGVYGRGYFDQGVWRGFYTPVQNFSGWLCANLGC